VKVNSGQPSLLPTTFHPAHTASEHMCSAWGSVHRASADHLSLSSFLLLIPTSSPNQHYSFRPLSSLPNNRYPPIQTISSTDLTTMSHSACPKCGAAISGGKSCGSCGAVCACPALLHALDRPLTVMLRPALTKTPNLALSDSCAHQPSS